MAKARARAFRRGEQVKTAHGATITVVSQSVDGTEVVVEDDSGTGPYILPTAELRKATSAVRDPATAVE